ncbi:MAG: hypothetical protein APF76_00345 [Desulfitibacter sp. BRH_c19]|nr:MAG: hypothetical protein APF76_00345 [Desulfitibacter sp. BRH_c19]
MKTIKENSRGLFNLDIDFSKFLIIIAVVIGTAGGLFAVFFQMMIGWANQGFHGASRSLFGFLPGNWWLVVVPSLAGIIVGPLVYFFAREAKGHGVPEVMEAVALKGGRMRMRVIFVKAIASASSIGAGASVGREGPIVQMGSGIGSVMGQRFKLNEEKIKTCVACGAAAGISATFNAPIAGVLFAQEVILGRFASATFIPIVISSVTASVIAQMFMGDVPAFFVHAYSLNHPLELILYSLLGVLAAISAVLFVKVLYKTEDIIDEVKILPEWSKPVFGGIVIGMIGLKFPQILGVGYETIEAVFRGEILLITLIALVFVKIIATSLTLGSGFSGGVFAPSLFIGATLGGAFGLIVQQVFPGISIDSGAYAIVGMGAVVAGATQAPITAILIIFEMTRDYRIILPLMIAVVFSTLIFSYLSKDSIYTKKLSRRGVNLHLGKDINIMKRIRVKEVMSSPVEVVQDTDKVGDVIKKMHNSKHNGFPVMNLAGELTGIIALHDIREAPVKGIMEMPVLSLMNRKLIVTNPDETLDDVFKKLGLHEIGHLPVVAGDNPKKLLGIITRSDIVKAYDKKLLTTKEIETA